MEKGQFSASSLKTAPADRTEDDGTPGKGGVQFVSTMAGRVEPALSTILESFEYAAIKIASFISAKDCLGLHTVNKRWHDVLTQHEETLFGYYLKRDFGSAVFYVAKEKNLSRKKLYRAFHSRWSLPEQGNQDTSVSVPRGHINHPPETEPAKRDGKQRCWRNCDVGCFACYDDSGGNNSSQDGELVFIGQVWLGADGRKPLVAY